MKSTLSTGQSKVVSNQSDIMARLLFGAHRSGFDIAVRDPHMPCRLMSRERWTSGKCRAYAFSGSRTCQDCWCRPDLVTVVDPHRIAELVGHPMITLQQFKQREELSMSKQGICAKCEEPRTIVAHGMCTGCNYGPNKDLTKEQVLAKRAEGKGRRWPSGSTTPLPPVGSARQRVGASLPAESEGILISLKTSEDNRLYDRILERAKKNRREPGEELLTLAETALDSGLASDKVEISKLRKIIERMKTYPVPNGSPKEVFGEAFNMMLTRLDEMEGA